MDKRLEVSWAEDERRTFRRVPCEGEVALRCAGREYILAACDVSEGGLRASPAEGIDAPAEGSLDFSLVPAACRCRVVYSTQGEGVGIEFLELSEESHLALRQFVENAN